MKGGEGKAVRVVSADLWENVEGQTMSEKRRCSFQHTSLAHSVTQSLEERSLEQFKWIR